MIMRHPVKGLMFCNIRNFIKNHHLNSIICAIGQKAKHIPTNHSSQTKVQFQKDQSFILQLAPAAQVAR